jgi:Kef-type K+ transport system membrane component KefB
VDIQPFIHLALIWTAVLLATWLAGHTRLTPVLWYLFMGALLVNLGLLPSQPLPFIEGFAELGIIVIMFALGFEETTRNFVVSIKRAWGIALFGAIAPFLTAWSLALWFWGDRNMALMCGLAMTATAISLTMVSLRSERLSHTRAATGIMVSAVLDDVASLVLVAILVPVALGSGPANIAELVWILVKVVLFFAFVVVASDVLFPHNIRSGWVARVPWLRKYGISHVIHIGEGMHATLVLMLVAMVFGLIGHAFGFHPAVGAYMAGLVLREEYFHGDGRAALARYQRTKHVIDDVAFTWIGPVFFVTLGGYLVFEAELALSIIDKAVLLFVALFFAQVLSAALAAHFTGRYSWRESVMIGFGMLGRAELAMVVLGIAYVQHPIINKEAFYTLMLTATLLNLTVPLAIRFWKPWFTGEKPMPAVLRWMGASEDPD